MLTWPWGAGASLSFRSTKTAGARGADCRPTSRERNQIGSPAAVWATRVTPAARNSSVPSRPSSNSPVSPRRPDNTSTAGNDDGRRSRGSKTDSTPV